MLYPKPDDLTGNNYPPLSFLITALLNNIFGPDLIVTGRIINLLSCIGTGICVVVLSRRLWPNSPSAGLWGGLLFIALNATLFRRYFAINDPQWLAHLFILSGVIALFPTARQIKIPVYQLMIAAALMIAGGFVKHNLLAFPLAATIWLTARDRRAFILWMSASSAMLTLCFLICYAFYGLPFFIDIFNAPRTYTLSRIITHSYSALLLLGPLCVAAWFILKNRTQHDSRYLFFRISLLLSIFLGLMEKCGDGVDINAYFDLGISLCIILAGGLVFRWCRVLVVSLFAVAYLFAIIASTRETTELTHIQNDWMTAIQFAQHIPGDIACDDQSLCYWAGKPYVLDFFLYGQVVKKTGNMDSLMKAIKENRFSTIFIFNKFNTDTKSWPSLFGQIFKLNKR